MNRSLVASSVFFAVATLVAASAVTTTVGAPSADTPASRGKYLVSAMGCNDCHTPWKMTDQGPAPDMSRMLSGHPEQLVMPPAPALPPGPWIGSFGATNTAWAGPWSPIDMRTSSSMTAGRPRLTSRPSSTRRGRRSAGSTA